jgi:predicted MPP superfamily phosphohydrolase
MMASGFFNVFLLSRYIYKNHDYISYSAYLSALAFYRTQAHKEEHMKKKLIAGILSCSMLMFSFNLAGIITPAKADSSGEMEVFISEIYPDDQSNQDVIEGAGGADLFEYVEIYNHSGQPLAFNEEYAVRYNYNTGAKNLTVTDTVYDDPAAVVIPADSPAVLWVKRTSSSITGAAANLTEADFRQYHSVPDDVPVYVLEGQDGLNNTDRGIYITRKGDSSAVISEYYYTADDVGDGKSVHLQLPSSGTAMVPFAREAAPSAGRVEPAQLMVTDNRLPEITHTPHAAADRSQPLTVTAGVYDEDGDSLTVKLYYKTVANGSYSELLMEDQGNGMFTGEIPSAQLGGDKLYYVLEAGDGSEWVRSPEYETALIGDVSNADVPRILITEILPNPAGDYRWGSGNQYEYLELYNNSDQTLDLKGYTLWYLYPGTTAPKKWTIPQHTSIEPYSTAVIWFAKEAVANGKGYTTTADFNLHFNSTLSDSDIIFYDNSQSSDFNLPNATHRGLALSSPDAPEQYIVEAWYDSTSAGSPDRLVNGVRNAVIRFAYPISGTAMMRLDNRMYANPGSIDPGQVPVVDGVDVVAPVLHHEQTAYNLGKGAAYTVRVTSDEPLASAEIWYGAATEEPTVFTGKQSLELSGEDGGRYIYEGSLSFDEAGVYRYIIDAADAGGNRTRVPYNSRGGMLTVNETGMGTELPDPGLSIESGSMLRGKASFYAYGREAAENIEVLFDGQPLHLRKTLPGKAQLGMQTRGVDQIYQASVSALDAAGEPSLFSRILPKYTNDAWSMFDMPADLFVTGTTVSVHTGNENAPYQLKDHDKVFGVNNHDDFEVKNVHLVLPDGSVVRPDKVLNYLGNLTQTTVDYREDTYYGFGDADYGSNPNKPMISGFHFPIPDEKFTARYSELDTSAVQDGIYPLTMTIDGQEIDAIQVMVDNTAPVIEGISYGDGQLLESSMFLKGPFTLNVLASDHLSGVGKIEAELDGRAVELPLETSSTILTQGEHRLKVTVYDGAGNSAVLEETFQIEDEKPLAPGEVSPADFAVQVPTNTRLRANVSDPGGDAMDVRFLQGEKYDFARQDGISGYTHVADREPPLVMTPDGEAEIADNEAGKIAFADGEYLVTDTDSGFPYHRFEVELEEEVQSTDKVELYWKGRTLPGRIVTLYAWDYDAGKWIPLKSETGQDAETDIVLTAEIEAGRFVRDGRIQAMVQDEVKSANDPFTILWFTDTQYYAESYPDIFDRLGDWIAEEYKKGTFAYAIHTGDIVNVANDEKQWEVADRNLKKLDDAGVPYGVLAGNHDVIIDGVNYSYYGKYVGADRYKDNPWYGGEMDNNRNHYDLFSFGGHDFIFLYIGFGLEDTPETVAWANEVLQKHADRIAIVGMHAYLETNGTLSNMAQNVFDQVIAPNKNVQLVLSGHYHAANRVVKTVTHPDGTTRQVIEMLADYQGGPEGGSGYVRLLKFDPTAGTLDVDTYSPYLDDYNFFDDAVEDFTEPFVFRDIQKRVATDYIAVNVYKDVLIGEQKGLTSGSVASVQWDQLTAGKTYYWYMDITDEYGASMRSPIYRFTTVNNGTTPTVPDPTIPGGGSDNNGDDDDDDDDRGNNGGGKGNNGGAAGNGGGGSSVSPGGNVQPVPSGSGTIIAQAAISTNRAIVSVTEAELSAVLSNVSADQRGFKKVTVMLNDSGNKFDGEFGIQLPSSFFMQADGRSRIEVVTPHARVTLPSGMLSHTNTAGPVVELVIRPDVPTGLSSDMLEVIGNRPAIGLTLHIDGKAVDWQESGMDVAVSVPYIPGENERTDGLVAWAVDKNGSANAVLNSHYNEDLQAVTFHTGRLGHFAVGDKTVSYQDVSTSSWYAKAVAYLSARDVVKGSGQGRFLPQHDISRADFLVMTMNAFGIDPASNTDTGNFTDAGNQYYSPYLAAARNMGLVKGTGDNRFRPEAKITRQDMAVILHSMIETAGTELSAEHQSTAQSFSDAGDIADYALSAMNDMLGTGLMQGTGDGQLSPKSFTNRAMAAQVIYNYLIKSSEILY